jgi:hypothetical protein
VYHNRSQPGLHTFTAMTSPDLMKILLATILEIRDLDAAPDTSVDYYEVDQTSFNHAESLFMNDGPQAVYERMVDDLNAPPSLARALAEQRKHLFGLLWRSDWQQPGYAYTDNTLLEDMGYILVAAPEGGFWVGQQEGHGPQMAIFKPMSGAALIDDMVTRLHETMSVA